MTRNIFKKCLGLILSAKHKEQKQLIYSVDPEWFETQFLKTCYDGIKDIVINERADILNLVQWMREKNVIQKDWIVEIAGLPNEVGVTDLMNVNAILNECYYVYSTRQISLVVANVNTELMAHAPNSQTILKYLQSGIDVLTVDNNTKETSNSESIDKVLDYHEKARMGISVGIDLGWNNLKKYIVLEEDDVMIVGGRPAMGKTAWAISLIRNIVFQQDKRMIFFSLEMSKERIIRRLISLILDIDSNRIKYGELTHYEIERIHELKKDPLWSKIHILDGSHSVYDLQREVLNINSRHDVDVFVIDYLQKILPEKSDSRYQEVTKISNNVKRLVMSQRIPCIALAQLNRDVARSGKRPSLPDLKESGEIEQDASIVCFLHRPEYYGNDIDEDGNSLEGIGEFITAKNRDGANGIVEMKVDLKTSNWADFNREDQIFNTPEIEEF